MRRHNGIKPQDILILLKLVTTPKASQKVLSESLQISQAEVSHALQRLKISNLMTLDSRVNRAACAEFLIHGLKYVFPAELGPHAVGIATSYAKPGFSFVRYSPNDIYVWPYGKGKIKGASIMPFYPSLPEACLGDEKLYILASLIEMIRAGRARERKIASDEIEKIMKDI